MPSPQLADSQALSRGERGIGEDLIASGLAHPSIATAVGSRREAKAPSS